MPSVGLGTLNIKTSDVGRVVYDAIKLGYKVSSWKNPLQQSFYHSCTNATIIYCKIYDASSMKYSLM